MVGKREREGGREGRRKMVAGEEVGGGEEGKGGREGEEGERGDVRGERMVYRGRV